MIALASGDALADLVSIGAWRAREGQIPESTYARNTAVDARLGDRGESETMVVHERLSTAANIAILLLAAVSLYRLLAPAVRPAVRSYEPGERLSVEPPNALGRTPRSLVISLKASCPHCVSSLPFYAALVEAIRAEEVPIDVLAISYDSPDVVRRTLHDAGVTVDAYVRPRGADVKLMTVPEILIVDGRGIVQRRWTGALSESGRQEVAEAIGLKRFR